jgi:hypothetical protein
MLPPFIVGFPGEGYVRKPEVYCHPVSRLDPSSADTDGTAGMAKRDVKVGVNEGGGPPPGYRWSVHLLDVAFDEAMSFLDADQYQHAAQLVKELAREQDPSHSAGQSVDAVGDFLELRDKGGILRNINLRVFFHLDADRSVLVVLGAIHKKNDGPTPPWVKTRINNRLRRYRRGDLTGP